MDVSGGIRANLDAGYPGRHDGELLFHVLWANARSWNTSCEIHVSFSFVSAALGSAASGVLTKTPGPLLWSFRPML